MIRIVLNESKLLFETNRGIKETKEIMKQIFPKIIEQLKIFSKKDHNTFGGKTDNKRYRVGSLDIAVILLSKQSVEQKSRLSQGLDTARGSYDERNSEIFIWIRPYEFETNQNGISEIFKYVYTTLYHEMIHHIQYSDKKSSYYSSTFNSDSNPSEKNLSLFYSEIKRRLGTDVVSEIKNNEKVCKKLEYLLHPLEVQAHVKHLLLKDKNKNKEYILKKFIEYMDLDKKDYFDDVQGGKYSDIIIREVANIWLLTFEKFLNSHYPKEKA